MYKAIGVHYCLDRLNIRVTPGAIQFSCSVNESSHLLSKFNYLLLIHPEWGRQCIVAGAHEPPKAAKERVTPVPCKYNFVS